VVALALALCVPPPGVPQRDAAAAPITDTSSSGEEVATSGDSLAVLLEILELPVEARIEVLLDRLMRLEAVARDEATGLYTVALIEARALADEVEELAAWGEGELAVELAVEAIRILETAGVRLPAAPGEGSGKPRAAPPDDDPADGGTSGSRTGSS
jgi:hypothetical protein